MRNRSLRCVAVLFLLCLLPRASAITITFNPPTGSDYLDVTIDATTNRYDPFDASFLGWRVVGAVGDSGGAIQVRAPGQFGYSYFAEFHTLFVSPGDLVVVLAIGAGEPGFNWGLWNGATPVVHATDNGLIKRITWNVPDTGTSLGMLLMTTAGFFIFGRFRLHQDISKRTDTA